MLTDEQLIISYLEGNDSSLAGLVDRYLDKIYAFAFRLTRDAQMAEDVTQESFIKAWKQIRTYKLGNSFSAWLFTIARRTAIDQLRQRRDIAITAFDTDDGENRLLAALADTAPLPEALLAAAEDAAYVQSVLAELDPRYREVLVLRYADGLTFSDIGQRLSRPLHTVKSQCRRGLAQLRRLLSAPAY